MKGWRFKSQLHHVHTAIVFLGKALYLPSAPAYTVCVNDSVVSVASVASGSFLWSVLMPWNVEKCYTIYNLPLTIFNLEQLSKNK